MPVQDEHQVGDITGEQFGTLIAAAPITAPGLDAIYKQDLKLLPKIALDRLAQLYNAIEIGTDWPTHNSTA